MPTISETFALAFRQHQAGDLQQARRLYAEILEADSDHVDALHLLALTFCQSSQHEVAITLFRKALAVGGANAVLYTNLGAAQQGARRLAEAADCYRQALQLQPDSAEAHNNLGVVLMEQGELDEAIVCFRNALRQNANYGLAHNNLGVALMDQGRQDETEACYRRAVCCQPDLALAHNNLGNVLRASQRAAEATVHLREALRLKPDLASTHSDLLFCLNFDAEYDAEAVFAEHCRWGSAHGQVNTLSPPANDPDPERRLRIGYVSPDFRNHAVARLFEPILANHDPRHIETICYAEVPVPDDVTTRLQALAQHWRSTCGLSDLQVAELVRSDAVDILVDLAGHTCHNRLRAFAYRPAPVQVSYLGYPNTTGLRAIDYYLADAVLVPPEETRWFTEEVIHLPHGVCCFAAPTSLDVGCLPVLSKGRITFGSLFRPDKLTANVYDLWSQVLKAIPDAGLLVFWPTMKGALRDRVYRDFTARGIAGDRLDLRHEAPPHGYLSVYRDIDVILDVVPWSGTTTICEALWMGVPAIGLCGQRLASRGTVDMLTQLGLTELIARTPDEYVALAVNLTADWDRLAQLRFALRDLMRTHVCDGRKFTRSLEEVYRNVWRRWCARPINHPVPDAGVGIT